jgi:hypothetical protein
MNSEEKPSMGDNGKRKESPTDFWRGPMRTDDPLFPIWCRGKRGGSTIREKSLGFANRRGSGNVARMVL